MKNTLIVVIVLGFLAASCTRNVYYHKSLPPGHAKKIVGSKSAKPYAPGQMKKHGHMKKRK